MPSAAKTLMIQGTASHVGKSVLTAALCSYFRQQGLRVSPFKSQTMSNNSFVTKSGDEIGRAQAFQAAACGIEPTVEMNPILLKPSSETGSQVVVLGKPVATMNAREYHAYQPQLIPVIHSAFESLASQFDVIVLEGAGSPAEINLHKFDIVNMAMAKFARAPVLLVGDIHAGGVFASLVGTIELLPPDERDLVKAFIINKFRGDLSLLDDGLSFLEARTGKPVLGVLPFVPNLEVDEEDGVARVSPPITAVPEKEKLHVAVIEFPRISNSTDFAALAQEPDVSLRYLSRAPVSNEPQPDVLILPGTKSTIADLEFLRASGLADYVHAMHAKRVPIIGICGGYQMLGAKILDPDRVESSSAESAGLALLPVVTVFAKQKQTVQVLAKHLASNAEVTGYEIHMGQTTLTEPLNPAFQITDESGQPTNRPDGCTSPDGQTWGTYIHGLFDNPNFRRTLLNNLRRSRNLPPLAAQPQPPKRSKFEILANLIRNNLDTKKLQSILDLGTSTL